MVLELLTAAVLLTLLIIKYTLTDNCVILLEHCVRISAADLQIFVHYLECYGYVMNYYLTNSFFPLYTHYSLKVKDRSWRTLIPPS